MRNAPQHLGYVISDYQQFEVYIVVSNKLRSDMSSSTEGDFQPRKDRCQNHELIYTDGNEPHFNAAHL